jgi:sigma-B regulation protein RsbU (phosphoserine phosphatase)
MAMTMVKLNGYQLRVSSAGMPSVLIYRAQTQTVEEIAMRALPLGGVTKYQYQQQEVTLAGNDVVVLMSDGLSERFNAAGEMLEHTRIQQALPALAQQPAEEIISALVRLGEEWSKGHPQDDDITFVVLRMK